MKLNRRQFGMGVITGVISTLCGFLLGAKKKKTKQKIVGVDKATNDNCKAESPIKCYIVSDVHYSEDVTYEELIKSDYWSSL